MSGYDGRYATLAAKAIESASAVNTSGGTETARMRIYRDLESAKIYAQLHQAEIFRGAAASGASPAWGSPRQVDSGADYYGPGGHGGDQWDR